MENQSLPSDAANPNAALITTFCEITSAAPAEALFYLESHNFDLSSAVSTFLESNDPDAQLGAPSPNVPVTEPEPYSPSQSKSQSSSPSRSRSPSPPPGRRQQYNLRSSSSSKPAPDAAAAGGSRRIGVSGVRTLSDLNRRSRSRGDEADTDSDDEPQEYYTGGEKSGMLVQDPSKADEVDEIFSQAWQSGGVESLPEQVVQPSSSSGRFTGTARLLSGETVSHASPQQQQQQAPASVMHTITFWRNGFTVEDGPLRRLDDPENASFLESIKKSECPVELMPTDRSTAVHVNLVRKEENYVEPKKPRRAFEGVGRTIGGESDGTLVEPAVVVSPPITTAPPPTTGLVVDQALPSTSIQLRLADGTRMVSRFNYHHTLRDIRGFIDASRPGGSLDYQLRTVGFPPKQLTDMDQTVEQAGLANSVVIQKLC